VTRCAGGVPKFRGARAVYAAKIAIIVGLALARSAGMKLRRSLFTALIVNLLCACGGDAAQSAVGGSGGTSNAAGGRGGGAGHSDGGNSSGGSAGNGGNSSAGSSSGAGGGGGGATRDCNGSTCTATQACIAYRTEGGAIRLPDAGACPTGESLAGSMCVPDFGYKCVELNGACQNQAVACACAAPHGNDLGVCPPGYSSCSEPGATEDTVAQLYCQQLVP
jgi:hypothetical protein